MAKKSKGGAQGEQQATTPTADEKHIESEIKAIVQSDGQWEEVVNPKKAKFQARTDRKKSEEQSAKHAEARAHAALHGSDDEDDFYAPKPRNESRKQQGNKPNSDKKNPAAKKQKTKDDGIKKPQNEKELTALITDILNSNPTDSLTLSAVGNRIQEMTNATWNKGYKQRFGALKDFVESQPVFQIDGESVKLKPQENVSSNSKSGSKKGKGQQNGNSTSGQGQSSTSTPNAKTQKKNDGQGSSDAVEEHSSISVIVRAAAIVALLGGVVFLTTVAIQGGDVKNLTQQIKAALKL